MPKFCANLSMLFGELEFLDRFEAAASAGFQGVEYLFPYGFEKEELVEQLRKHELTQVLYNLPAGNWGASDRGIGCHPDRVDEFREGVDQAIEYAKTLGCERINCLAGIAPDGIDAETLHETFVTNLRFAAEKLAEAGVRLLIEPINLRDIPGFYLNHSEQALSIIKEVDSDNLGLQYDIYHMQIMEGDLAQTIERHLERIGHVQIADNPGRHEPGTGEINFPFLFQWLDRLEYSGWVGCEYKPRTTTVEGLGWVKPYLAS